MLILGDENRVCVRAGRSGSHRCLHWAEAIVTPGNHVPASVLGLEQQKKRAARENGPVRGGFAAQSQGNQKANFAPICKIRGVDAVLLITPNLVLFTFWLGTKKTG